jgi:hypothetical protein
MRRQRQEEFFGSNSHEPSGSVGGGVRVGREEGEGKSPTNE